MASMSAWNGQKFVRVMILCSLQIVNARVDGCDASFRDLENLPTGWAKDSSIAVASAKVCAGASDGGLEKGKGHTYIRAPRGASGARLSYGHDASTMSLTWEMPNTTSASYVPVVELSTSGQASTIVKGTVEAPAFCGTMGPMMVYVNITGLQPNTKYKYRYGEQAGELSTEMSFTTAPELDTESSIEFAVYGDMGVDWSSSTIQVLEAMAKSGDIDFVVHNGDIAYADNRYDLRNHTVYQDWLDYFYANISGIATQVPYMLNVGNHEAPCDYSEFLRRAAMVPFAESGSPSPFYYSRQHGYIYLIHISIFLSSNTSAEFAWLQHELHAAHALKQAGKVSWIFTFTHYMQQPTGYCTYSWSACCNGTMAGDGKPCTDAVGEFFKQAEDLFVQTEVDIHFTAHQHSYERTVPMYRYAPQPEYAGPVSRPQALFTDPTYPMYVVCGSPGNVETFPATYMTPQAWSVPSQTQSFGFVHVTANQTTLSVDYRATSEILPGQPSFFTADHFVLTRSKSGQDLKRAAIQKLFEPSAKTSILV